MIFEYFYCYVVFGFVAAQTICAFHDNIKYDDAYLLLVLSYPLYTINILLSTVSLMYRVANISKRIV